MYTITHACGHTHHVETRHGYLAPSTVRFLANSRCDECTNATKDCTHPQKSILKNGTQFYCPTCKRILPLR